MYTFNSFSTLTNLSHSQNCDNFREFATLGFPRKPLVDWADGHFPKRVDSVEYVESVCPRQAAHLTCGLPRTGQSLNV